jgi:hypothetical protein
MAIDAFGDLQEWGDVLTTLARLRAAEELDRHQDGLARLMRCRENWRLREEALMSAAEVRRPASSLVAATMRLLVDQEESLENRILAARAMGSMLVSCQAESDGQVDISEALATMQSLMSNGGPPVLHAAVRSACAQATCS